MDKFAKKKGIGHLPLSSVKEEGGRKEWLRKKQNSKHLAEAEEEGNKLRTGIRNDYMGHINQHGSNPENTEGVERIRNHLLNQHFRSNASEHESTPFIVVSGHGTSKDPNDKNAYAAHAHFMDEHPHVEAVKNATHFTSTASKGKDGQGGFGLNVYAHTHEHPNGVHVMKMDTKWNSQGMASGIKVVGTEGSLKPKPTDDVKKPIAKKTAVKKVPVKKPVVKRRIVEGYGLSSDDAFEMLTLGTGMDEIDLNENHKNYLKDSKGNVRIFIIRGAAAKEAHVKNGTVVPYGRGYAVLLEEKQNDYHVFEKFIETQSADNRGKETPSRSTILTESTERGNSAGSGSGGRETDQQNNAERKGPLTFKEITARQEAEKVKLSEAGINAGESGLSMATSGENMGRDSTKVKILKRPLEELTGDETGASIGDQKEDELKKKGISITSFKKRNYV